MNSNVAKKMLEAARVKANEIGKPVSIAIVDTAGLMVIFERLNDSRPFTSFVAEAKAQASALSGMDSAALVPIAQNNPGIVNALAARVGGRFAPAQGAVVLKNGNEIAGAIGVSGATSQEDEQIAQAGAAAFSA